MVTLDSNKIEVPIHALKRFSENADYVVKEQKTIQGQLISDKYTIQGISSGLNYIEVNILKQSVIVATSAKILSDDYLRGVSIDTIEHVIDQVNELSSSFIEFDKNVLIEESRFLNLDTTNNLHLSSGSKSYLDALHSYKFNSMYKCDYHQEKGNQGIEFKGNQRSFKERMIFYDKYVELSNKAENRLFFQSVRNPVKLLNNCKNLLRVEQNSVQLRKIRERFNVGNTNVLSVLNSPINPNYNLAIKVLKGADQLTLFEELDEFDTFHSFEKYKGQQTIIRECNYDISLIEQIMKHFFSKGTNLSKQKREYKGMIFAMMERERMKKNSNPGLVGEILELLKAC